MYTRTSQIGSSSKSGSPISPFMIRSQDCPIAFCCVSALSKTSHRLAVQERSRFCALISITSKKQTMPLVMRSVTNYFAPYRDGLKSAAQGAFTARVGGDEFTVVLPIRPRSPAAAALADRLLKAVAEEFEIRGGNASK